MTVPGNLSSPLLATAAAAAGAVEDNRSLRFNSGDTATLSFTPSSAGNRKKWTWAGWVKRSELGRIQNIFRVVGALSDTTVFQIRFMSDDTIGVVHYSYFTLISDAVFRDVGAWLHLVVSLDVDQTSNSDKLRFYINGSELTSWSTDNRSGLSTNAQGVNQASVAHTIGGPGTSEYFSGYLADIYFIDGSQLDPTSFGAYDSNGVWQKADYSGTFGTNGFHLLDFANESTIGHDSSGNNNDFTANNLSDTAGAGNDVLFDYPANGDTANDSGAGGQVNGNYATLNPLSKTGNTTLSNGNLEFSGSTNGDAAQSTIGVSSGKWYWEAEVTTQANGQVGIVAGQQESGLWVGKTSSSWSFHIGNGNKYNNNIGESYSTGTSVNDIVGVALDLDSATTTLTFYKNGSSLGTAYSNMSGEVFFPAVSRSSSAGAFAVNFGQRAFAYSAPSGFKALCTTNLPTPTIADGSDYFEAKTWDGDGQSTRTISGLSFSPDFVWLKNRSAAYAHILYDAVRGVGSEKALTTIDNRAEGSALDNSTYGYLNTLTSDGFTLVKGSDSTSYTNGSSSSYIAWAWDAGSSTVSNTDGSVTSSVRANQSAGISVVTFTNPSSGAFTVGHGLNAQVGLVFMKHRNRAGDWLTWFSGFSNSEYLVLNSTATKATASEVWGSSAPGSSTFGGKIGVSALAGDTDVAYCFAPVEGFSAMGTWNGNSSTGDDQPFIYCGFRPRFILWKKYAGQTDNWFIFDTARDPHNRAENWLIHTEAAENSDIYNKVDILSNGFKMRVDNASFGSNTSHDFLFYAVAENPFQANGGLAR